MEFAHEIVDATALTYRYATRREEHPHRTVLRWARIRLVVHCDERATLLQGDRATLAEVRYHDLQK